MKILAVDTSSLPVSAVVTEDEQLLAQYYQNTGLTHSRTLMPLIESMLKNSDIDVSDIGLMAATSGPGSFTGIRIGVSTVKGMAFYSNIPCEGVSSLLAMAHTACYTERVICALIDARQDNFYNALFRIKDKKPERLTPDRVISAESLLLELKQLKENYILVGDGAKKCYNILSENDIDFVLPPENLIYQNAYGAALAAFESYSKDGAKDGSFLRPSYLRVPQAERERIKKGGKDI